MKPHNGHHWLSRAYWTETGVIPRWQLLAVYGIIVCGGLWGFHQADAQRDEIEAQAIRSDQRIQESRRDAVIISCRQQNERHDRTIRQLDRNIAGLPRGPERLRARQRRDSTVSLIDALVPKTDCKQRAEMLVK